MAEGAPDVVVQNTTGGQSADINVSAADTAAANAAAANAAAPSAANLGVTEQQFAKFYNAETKVYNWQAHATEAEFRAKGAKDTPEATPAAAEGTATDADAKNAVTEAGLDFGTLEDKIVDNGDIDAGDYAALAGIGLPETLVKDYIESVKDRADVHVANVMEAFGGDAGLNQIKEYAAKNYTAEEMADIDAKIADPNQYKAIIDMLRHQAGVLPGSTGTPVTSPNALGGGMDGVVGYANDAEMQVDMRNPKYKTDPNFRQEVTRKVAAATYQNNPRSHAGGL
jgi:hypothetical protein